MEAVVKRLGHCALIRGSHCPVHALLHHTFSSMPPVTTTLPRAQEDAITRFTTPHFRSPEMVDLYSGTPLDARVDVWVRAPAVPVTGSLLSLV